MESLGAILWRTLRDLGIGKPVKQAEAIRIWPKVAGEKVSQMTEPQFISNGKLFIRVKSDVWRNELFFHKQELLQRLNQMLGERVIEDIILK